MFKRKRIYNLKNQPDSFMNNQLWISKVENLIQNLEEIEFKQSNVN